MLNYKFQISRAPDSGIWIDGIFRRYRLPFDRLDQPQHQHRLLDRFRPAGAGIITRCCASLLDYLFDDLRLHRVEIRCGTGNTRSCAIPRTLGFLREGVLRKQNG